jgi:Zn-dependent protease/CBS domain-containing protein
MKRSITFPKIAGISVNIHWTFSLIIIYIIYVNARAGLDAMQIGWSVLFVLSLFVCVTLHEFGHAMAAKRYGIKTKDITLYPIGGVARLEKMPEKPLHELGVALAGPAVNVAVMALLYPAIESYDFQQAAEENAMVIGSDNFLAMLGVVNIWLALFNLIPAFPMDGGRVLRALLAMKMDRIRATEIAALIGKFLAIGFIIAGFYMNPFLIFIGLFIILGAQAEADMVKTQFFITGMKAEDAAMTRFTTIEKDRTIADAIKLLLDGEAKSFVITEQGKPFGSIGRDQLIKGLKNMGESALLEQITEHKPVTVEPGLPLKEVFTLLQQSQPPLILVMKDEKLLGVINSENISELIMVQTALSQSGNGSNVES